MMKNGKKSKALKGRDPYNLGNISDFLYENFTVMSANECTGLIPSDPETETRRDNYKDIYDIN